MENQENIDELNPKQEIFCRNYAGTREFFGNGVASYCDAYNLDINDEKDYKTAKVNASKLLTNANIIKRINSLLDASGLNDENVDKQTAFLISQNVDFRAKISAIKEYNAVRGRIKQKIQHKIDDDSKQDLKDIVSMLKGK